MSIKVLGGSNPHAGKVMTTQGLKAARPPLCMKCGQRREGQLYTVNANGQQVCADCASSLGAGILKACENGAGPDCACSDPDDGGE